MIDGEIGFNSDGRGWASGEKPKKSGTGLGDGELLTPQKERVKISSAGKEGRLEETQEEVLPHDAKCDNANNLTIFQR